MKGDAQSSVFQLNNDIRWESAAPKITRQLLGYNDKIMMVKVKFEKDGVGALHEHPHTQVTYVESGAFEMTIGPEKKILRAGDGYYVPPHVVHGCLCLEDGMLIDVFTPMREDFLPGNL